MDANTSELSLGIAQAMCDTLSTEFDEITCSVNPGASRDESNEPATFNMCGGTAKLTFTLEAEPDSNNDSDQTIVGSYLGGRYCLPNQQGTRSAGGYPFTANLNPSLTMSRKAKIDNGWEPAYKILSRNPSYPGKIYRRQKVSGPRPNGRTCQEMKQHRRNRAFYNHSESDGTEVSSWTSTNLHVVNHDISTFSEAPIHRALRRVEGSNDGNSKGDIQHLAALYIKNELCGSEHHSDDDSSLLKPVGVRLEGSGVSYRCHGVTHCGCRGRQSLKCGGKRAIASVKRLTLAGKAKIVDIFKK